jgi:membrane-bound lytic murein transglycosylase F
MHRIGIHLIIAVSMLALTGIAWIGTIRPPDDVALIRQRGELVVATRVGPSTYYREDGEARGMEYDLAAGFAEKLGVRLRIRAVSTLNEAVTELDAGRVDLVAAGIAPTPKREERFDFTDAYMQVYPKLVYRQGTKRPKSLADIGDGRIEVLADSSHESLLKDATAEHPELNWHRFASAETKELLYRVWRGRSDYAITDSNKLTLNQHFYPELRAAFDVGEAHGLAWMLSPDDDTLRQAANDYLKELRDNRGLTRLMERYYGHLERFDYVGTKTLMRHTTQRLPQYLPLFKDAAANNGIDWRLLAAIGYQESHWEPSAVSPTGVRGIMMLTQATSRLLGVEDRTDPEQSIRGGARYFDEIRRRLPESIKEPARTWFALASYNVGLGHLEDARVITQKRGGDPDSWTDVKANLPLLSEKEWYTQTRHGKARGWEPVRYVENIRKYYQLLKRVTDADRMDPDKAPKKPTRRASDPAGWRFNNNVESAL